MLGLNGLTSPASACENRTEAPVTASQNVKCWVRRRFIQGIPCRLSVHSLSRPCLGGPVPGGGEFSKESRVEPQFSSESGVEPQFCISWLY